MNGSRKVERNIMDHENTRCSLAELVEDPLIGLLMKSDGVDRRSLEVLLARVARERPRAAHGFQTRLHIDEAVRCSRC
jgi:hypothetical protein